MPWSRLAHAELVGGAVGGRELDLGRVLAADASAPSPRSSSSRCCAPSRRGRRRPSPRSSAASARTRPVTVSPGPGSANSQPRGVSATSVERTRSIPPRRWRTPSSERTPFAIQGVVAGPSLMRPSATSSHVSRAVPGEARPLEPDPALRVLGAPVVADHAGPAVELDRALSGPHDAAEAGRRVRALELRARNRCACTSILGAGGGSRRRRARGRAPRRRRGGRSRRAPRPGRDRTCCRRARRRRRRGPRARRARASPWRPPGGSRARTA